MMDTKKHSRMYDNQLLEILSWSGPKLMIPFHLILIFLVLFFGISYFSNNMDLWQIIFWFAMGILAWTLTEYLMHRFVFHFESENKLIKAFHFAMHGYHHDHPHDANRLFMPPVPALILLSLFFGLYYLFIGSKTFFFLPGFELGYLVYSFIHYCIHTRKAPKKLEGLWHHHIVHHYKEPEKAFGVSSRIWDRFFKTLPED